MSVPTIEEEYWDPDVDNFLLQCVEEQLQNSSHIDFTEISDTFLDVLGNEANDVDEESLEKFSPEGLCRRWMEIHTDGIKQEYFYSRAVVAVESSRDRVVDAMQNFLLGLPVQNPNLNNPSDPNYNPQEDEREDKLQQAYCNFMECPTPEKHQALLILEEAKLNNPLLFSQLRILEPLLVTSEGRTLLMEAAHQRREQWKGDVAVHSGNT